MTAPDTTLALPVRTDTASTVLIDNWRSDDHRDRLRYPVAPGSDAWKLCIDHVRRSCVDTPRLFEAYEECLTALQSWVSQATEALADRILLPSVHPSAPTFGLHLLLPTLHGLNILGTQNMQAAIELQREALTLSVRLMAARVCEGYNDNGHPAVVRFSDALKWGTASLGEATVNALPEVIECAATLRGYEEKRQELENKLNDLSTQK